MTIEDRRIAEEKAASDKAAADKAAADKAAQDAAALKAKEPKVLDGEYIPEALRGRTDKEIVDMMLATAAEIERVKAENLELIKGKSGAAVVKSPEEVEAEEDKRVFLTPSKFMKEHTEKRLAPIQQTVAELQANIAENAARARHKDFPKYEKRVGEIMKVIPPEIRGQAQTWDAAVMIAKGEEYDRIQKEDAAKAGLHSETGGSPAKTATEKEIPRPLADLSSDQIEKAAARFGMTKAEYIEWSEKYEG